MADDGRRSQDNNIFAKPQQGSMHSTMHPTITCVFVLVHVLVTTHVHKHVHVCSHGNVATHVTLIPKGNTITGMQIHVVMVHVTSAHISHKSVT